jgi:hypothetical protein
MPQSEQSPSLRREAPAAYYYRRKLGVRELLPAIGIAIGAGMFAYYVTRLLLQRTPLMVDRTPKVAGRRMARSKRLFAADPENTAE